MFFYYSTLQINQKDFLMHWQLFSLSSTMQLLGSVSKIGKHFLTLFACILPHMRRIVWGSFGMTDLIGGHNITFVRIWYLPKIKCQRLTGNWPNIKLMQQDGSSGKVWLLFCFELTSSLVTKKWLLATMSTLKFDIIWIFSRQNQHQGCFPQVRTCQPANGFSQVFLLKNHLLHTYYLGFDRSQLAG